MFFSQDWRERVKAENPDASFGEFVDYMRAVVVAGRRGRVTLMKRKLTALVLGELGKLLGAKWKELDESEKKVSVALAVGARHHVCESLRVSRICWRHATRLFHVRHGGKVCVRRRRPCARIGCMLPVLPLLCTRLWVLHIRRARLVSVC